MHAIRTRKNIPFSYHNNSILKNKSPPFISCMAQIGEGKYMHEWLWGAVAQWSEHLQNSRRPWVRFPVAALSFFFQLAY